MPHERIKLWLAHSAVWTVWGSTYLAVRFTVQTVPPYFMTGTRFLTAGALLFVWLRWRGESGPDLSQWRSGAVVGALLIGGGNGVVAWVAQTVPSGLIALSVALMPGWMLLFDWLVTGTRPTPSVLGGLALGFTGVGILIGPEHLRGSGIIHPVGALALAGASMVWAIGSIYSRSAARHGSPFMHTSLQMMTGGALLLVVASLIGETGRVTVAGVTRAPVVAAWLYLVLLGSIVAYTAYIYLLHHTTPGKAATYAYVNPIIAVLLGWAIGNEALNGRIALAAVFVVTAVAIIIRYRDAGEAVA